MYTFMYMVTLISQCFSLNDGVIDLPQKTHKTAYFMSEALSPRATNNKFLDVSQLLCNTSNKKLKLSNPW